MPPTESGWKLAQPPQDQIDSQESDDGRANIMWFFYRPFIAPGGRTAEMLNGNRDNGLKFTLFRVGKRWVVKNHKTAWSNTVDALVPAR